MALKIKLKRTSGVPTTSDLETGEFGFNESNNRLYVNLAGTITVISGGGAPGSGIQSVAEDSTPQLGGNLDVNGQDIVSTSNADIDIIPDGTGDVNLGNFKFDVDQSVGSGQDDYVLTYNHSTGKISLEAASGGGGSGEANQNAFSNIAVSGQTTVAADSATDTLTLAAGSNITLTTDASTDTVTIASSGGGGAADFSAVAEDILPDADGTRNLGSASKRFAELFLTGNTINLGGATISSDGTGTIAISGDGVTLPNNSRVAAGEKLAVANEEGVPIRKIDLFTKAGGLTTAATTLNFKAAASRNLVFTGLTLANGNSITATQQTTLFEF